MKGRLFTSCVLMVAIVSGGCVKTITHKVARYERGGERVTQTVPRTGMYKVKWARKDSLHGIDQTTRVLHQGEPAGFETGPDGQVYAIAGLTRFPINDLPDEANLCVWYHRSHQPTQFARELSKAMEGAQDAAMLTATAGIVAGGVYLELYGNSQDDCYDDSWPKPRHHRHHK